MIGFLRRLFGKKEPPKYLDGLYEIAMKRGMEELPCCGKMRRNHAHFRSGLLMCPPPPPDFRNFKYNPLEEDTCYFPPWGEKHFKCDTCGCARGVHVEEGYKRGLCMDPDCPGCPTGCK